MSKTDRSEAARIADQLRRAFDGEAWHGDSLFEILEGVTAARAAARAAARPIAGAHTIWELVLHIAAWGGALAQVRRGHVELIAAVASLPDSRLDDMVPGKEGAHYTFYYMLHGVVQHELYHAGQIALLKKG